MVVQGPPPSFEIGNDDSIPDDELMRMVSQQEQVLKAKLAQVQQAPQPLFQAPPPGATVIREEVEALRPRPVPMSATVQEAAPRQDTPTKINRAMNAEDIVQMLKKKQVYEPVQLPSKFYGYGDLGVEAGGTINVKQMTVTEEKILSTARLLKSGQALDKIFENCTLENIDPRKLFQPDRQFLIYYIRGISYGSIYEFKAKCPSCEAGFDEEIDLDELPVRFAEPEFNDTIHLVLPESGLNVWHRVMTGDDEIKVQKHRDFMIKGFGANFQDDTIVFRNSIVVKRIEHFEDFNSIERIVTNLSIKDSNALRDSINNPPFGVQSKIHMTCPFCYNTWEMELPIDANFFFPTTKKA